MLLPAAGGFTGFGAPAGAGASLFGAGSASASAPASSAAISFSFPATGMHVFRLPPVQSWKMTQGQASPHWQGLNPVATHATARCRRIRGFTANCELWRNPRLFKWSVQLGTSSSNLTALFWVWQPCPRRSQHGRLQLQRQFRWACRHQHTCCRGRCCFRSFARWVCLRLATTL